MRARVLVVAGAVLAGLATVVPGPAQAVQIPQDRIVSDDPAGFTPNVLDGQVNTIAQFGNQILLGGSFTQVQAAGSTTTLSRRNLLSFNATTGAISTTFLPNPDREVTSIIPAGDGTSVFVGGFFNSVGGGNVRSVARINATTGARIASFAPPALDGRVKDLRLANGRLWVAGNFNVVAGNAQSSLATLNPTTGAFDGYMRLVIDGLHNGGTRQVIKMDIDPTGTRLVAIGNFTTVSSEARRQIFMLDLTGPTARLANWQTNFYAPGCARVFNTYMRDLDFSPDGAYFVVTTTGAYRGSTSPCDETARWERDAVGSDLRPTWIDHSGGDTTYAVAVTGTAVYIGGHARWQNNPFAGDRPGAGAVSRPGIAALDPVNGLPFSWNPTRARGVGVFDMLATPSGLWVGSDTDRIGDFEYHARIAFFPLNGGTTVAPNNVPGLPNDIYVAGQQSTGNNPTTTNTITRRSYDGTTFGATTAIDSGGRSWSTLRGAFMLNGQLYTGWSDGSFTRQLFDGTTYGSPVPVNTSDLLANLVDWHTDVSQATGMFFADGRIYYTLSGSSTLFYRYFTPESDVVGAARFAASTDVTGITFSTVQAMFLSGNKLYWSSTDGILRRIDVNQGVPVAGTATTLSGPGIDGHNWRARSLFLFQDTDGGGSNRPPTAVISVSCADVNCSFAGGGSSDPDGAIASYAWDFGDGANGSGVSPTHRYAGSGVFTASLTVTDNDGATASVSRRVTVTHVNTAPTASFGVSCAQLECSFDGSGSSDSDGSLTSYTWDFGDGASGSGVSVSHTYASAGPRSVSLTVTDDQGATGSVTNTANPSSAAISFVGSAGVNANATSFSVTVPAGVRAGDTLLLFVTGNDTAPTVSVPSGGAWTSTGTSAANGMFANGWHKVASAGDAGSTVRVTSTAFVKVDMRLLVYRGASADPVSALATETVTRSTHTTPTVAGAGGWLVSYWSDKSSSTTAWTLPAGVTGRTGAIGVGSGRITSVVADSGATVPSGSVGGLTAAANSASAKAMMFSVLLTPVG